MDEASYRLADVILKVLAGLSVGIGGVFAWLRYLGNAKRDSQRGFRDGQIYLYLRVAELAGEIAATEPSSAREDLERRFWALYYGPIAVVQDAEVATTLLEFAAALRKGQRKTTLRTKSLDLAKACRSSIEKTWDIKLGALHDAY